MPHFADARTNADEAAVVEGINVYAIENIREVVDFFNGEIILQPHQ